MSEMAFLEAQMAQQINAPENQSIEVVGLGPTQVIIILKIFLIDFPNPKSSQMN